MWKALCPMLCAVLFGAVGCTEDGAPSTTTVYQVDATTMTATTTTTSLPSTTVSTSLPPLVDDYGCGRGFWIGSSDQTVGLFVFFTNTPAVSSLPAHGWHAEVWTGHDLFATWCDPDVDPAGPRAVVDERWRVVAGSIIVVEMPGSGEWGPAGALLIGFEAVTGDGTRIYLGDFEVHNPSWGMGLL
jgi:hypothetical protein